MFMCRKRDRAKIRLKAGIAILALAIAGEAARADDSAPPAAPSNEGAVQSFAKKVETFHASQVPIAKTIAKTITMPRTAPIIAAATPAALRAMVFIW